MKKQCKNMKTARRVNGAQERARGSSMSYVSGIHVVLVLVALACGIAIGVFSSDIIDLLMKVAKMVPEKILDTLMDIVVAFVLRQLKRVFSANSILTWTRRRL